MFQMLSLDADQFQLAIGGGERERERHTTRVWYDRYGKPFSRATAFTA